MAPRSSVAGVKAFFILSSCLRRFLMAEMRALRYPTGISKFFISNRKGTLYWGMSAAFHPVEWSLSSNIYEVNLRQYTPEGTIPAFARQMPRLREMGIDILWFMPITPISHDHRLGTLGSYYACSDYTAINPEYGTLDDFTQLVKEAHALGFKVIIDIVANHTGWDHRWTREHPDYYRRNAEGQFFDPHGWADVIDLNYDNPALRKAMIGVMRFWIDNCDVDGFRCDMAVLV